MLDASYIQKTPSVCCKTQISDKKGFGFKEARVFLKFEESINIDSIIVSI